MKLFLIFYAATGLLFILAICRAASQRNLKESSIVKVDFHTETIYHPNIVAGTCRDEQQELRKCA